MSPFPREFSLPSAAAPMGIASVGWPLIFGFCGRGSDLGEVAHGSVEPTVRGADSFGRLRVPSRAEDAE